MLTCSQGVDGDASHGSNPPEQLVLANYDANISCQEGGEVGGGVADIDCQALGAIIDRLAQQQIIQDP